MIHKKLYKDNFQTLNELFLPCSGKKKHFLVVCTAKSETSEPKQPSLFPLSLYRFLHKLNINISVK